MELLLTAQPDHPALPRGRWVVLRDFLRYGLDEPTGDGEVRIRPDDLRDRVWLELARPGRAACVSLPRETAREFLDRTERGRAERQRAQRRRARRAARAAAPDERRGLAPAALRLADGGVDQAPLDDAAQAAAEVRDGRADGQRSQPGDQLAGSTRSCAGASASSR